MITIRPAKESDLNYVVSSWIRSVRGQYPYKLFCKPAMTKYSDRVQRMVYGHSQVTVAADAKDEDVILGWMVHDPGVLHFAWVKLPFRRNGFGTKLFRSVFGADECLFHTCHTGSVTHARLDKKWGIGGYDPILVEDLLFPETFKRDAEVVNDKLSNKKL